MNVTTKLSATAVIGAILLAIPTQTQLRIVNYNTAGAPHAGLDTGLLAIDNELTNGFAKPIDVLSLQEQSSSATTTQNIADLLKGMCDAGIYDRATLDGITAEAGQRA